MTNGGSVDEAIFNGSKISVILDTTGTGK